MDTATRVSKMLAVIDEMSNRYDWAQATLILDEFGANPIAVGNYGYVSEYIHHRVSSSHEKVIDEIHKFLFSREPVESLDKVSEPNGLRQGIFLFISHSSDDRHIAADLKQSPQSYGVHCFVAHDDIEPTREWANEIATALDACNAFCGLCSMTFSSSWWANQEIGWALARGIVSISIRYDDDPRGFFGMRQAIRQWQNTDDLAYRIFEICSQDERTKRYAWWSLVNSFRESPSFKDARDRFALLERIEVIDEEMESALLKACEENRQISDCLIKNQELPQAVRYIIERKRAPRDGGGVA